MASPLKRALLLGLLVSLMLSASHALGQPTPLSAVGVSGSALGPAAQVGSLTMVPVSGPPGTGVTVAGTIVGACANVPLRVLWDGSQIVGEADSGGEGDFGIHFTVPLGAAVGRHAVLLSVVPSACEFPDLQIIFDVTNPRSLGTNPAPAATSRTPVPRGLVRGPLLVVPSVDRGHGSSYVIGEPISYCVFVTRTAQVLLASALPDGGALRHYEGALAPGEFCLDSIVGPPLGWRWVRAEVRDGEWVIAWEEVGFLVTEPPSSVGSSP